MGKQNGFMEYKRHENPMRDPLERVRSWDGLKTVLSDEERREQAARCMNCGVPFCQSAMVLGGMVTGCPLHNLIPEWNDALYHGQMESALERLLLTSPFPEFTSMVCPALCEKACLCGVHDGAVSIHDNENAIIEYAFSHGLMKPRIPERRSGKKAAVVGGGPAGLAAAYRLNQMGHSVTVYEREARCGGLLMYGIPNMKLPKEIIERRIDLMKEEGISFVNNTEITAENAESLKEEYDAVVLACGAKNPRVPDIEGIHETKGVYMAVDYLSNATRRLLHVKDDSSEPYEKIDAKGKNVVILGGGDTGNDCLATAIRQNAKSVTQLEMMPSPPKERAASNPWPEWPRTLKTDYGQSEAIAMYGSDPRIYETTITGLRTENSNLKALWISKVKMENRQMKLVPNTQESIPCDLLLIAAGFLGPEEESIKAFQLETSPRSTVKTETGCYSTNQEGIFTAGDMHRGQSLVVWAISEGQDCAEEVNAYLEELQ